LIEKLESKLILLTHLPNIFNDFSSVNFVKTQLFVSSLDNYLFVKKGLARAVNLQGLANAFNVLKKYNREKIEEIIINLNSHNIFKSKIKDCSAEGFFGSVSIIHKLSPTVTDSMIKTYQEKLKSGKKVSIQFSQLCDALYRLGKIDKELAQKLLIDFKPLLIESYKNIGFRKLSSGLNTIGKLNKGFAQSLLRDLPIEDLKNRIDNILNNENNINGALGEIRKVDEKIWKTLYEYANA
jgi:positive regulator of sigma E activity